MRVDNVIHLMLLLMFKKNLDIIDDKRVKNIKSTLRSWIR